MTQLIVTQKCVYSFNCFFIRMTQGYAIYCLNQGFYLYDLYNSSHNIRYNGRKCSYTHIYTQPFRNKHTYSLYLYSTISFILFYLSICMLYMSRYMFLSTQLLSALIQRTDAYGIHGVVSLYAQSCVDSSSEL